MQLTYAPWLVAFVHPLPAAVQLASAVARAAATSEPSGSSSVQLAKLHCELVRVNAPAAIVIATMRQMRLVRVFIENLLS
jgi:hypothetical protein